MLEHIILTTYLDALSCFDNLEADFILVFDLTILLTKYVNKNYFEKYGLHFDGLVSIMLYHLFCENICEMANKVLFKQIKKTQKE